MVPGTCFTCGRTDERCFMLDRGRAAVPPVMYFCQRCGVDAAWTEVKGNAAMCSSILTVVVLPVGTLVMIAYGLIAHPSRAALFASFPLAMYLLAQAFLHVPMPFQRRFGPSLERLRFLPRAGVWLLTLLVSCGAGVAMLVAASKLPTGF